MQISIMIPALNEEKRLAGTVFHVIEAARQCGGVLLDIIIVNDNSTDGTADVIKKLEMEFPFVHSVCNNINLGLGSGLKKVVKIAKYKKFMIIPGDDDLDQEIILTVFRNANKADIITTYFLNEECRGRFRVFLSLLFRMIYFWTFSVPVQYIQGPALYPTERIMQLNIISKGISIAPEITTKLLRLGYSFYEVGGYRRMGIEGSSALSLKNFKEVICTFLALFFEICVFNKKVYNKQINRIF